MVEFRVERQAGTTQAFRFLLLQIKVKIEEIVVIFLLHFSLKTCFEKLFVSILDVNPSALIRHIYEDEKIKYLIKRG